METDYPWRIEKHVRSDLWLVRPPERGSVSPDDQPSPDPNGLLREGGPAQRASSDGTGEPHGRERAGSPGVLLGDRRASQEQADGGHRQGSEEGRRRREASGHAADAGARADTGSQLPPALRSTQRRTRHDREVLRPSEGLPEEGHVRHR